ncbi:ABC transporter ATP-binding protein [Brachyspira hampsonii]|uniref:Spermidine/putrescine import ATP-binding protein PotA n=1 Tax=Brachyspira hampsonii TaxID=1287055 RepID=A0AAC9TS13_9SPIR|nr:ABC transporter ATP-binding protein [Brachyspira hampsonii]ASJ22265.1 polyamine ABC transporter ATP-binding protein [Brachyspira hampsonii]ELV05136.1 ABC transporter BitD [Brachyspira hampsonii 30599]MBW5380817.1 ABC transporter ATP-binding protein [Brachyspira hampsonii]MBW5411159.1 ABC transporter ATP-binding protein [Brachyspira hampsonii]OEJ17669.1 peptide ABC transporter substrate-binding protein [Brachyspira hampsonii]
MSVSISIANAVKSYENLTIIPDLSLNIKNGEFFTLLGPSGCGKTTLLRMIAGFNTIEGGTIKFDEDVINNIPAHKRNIGMVFQNYAIFPHMTVRENVEYGLKLRKENKETMKKKVDEILHVVKIEEYQHRLPEILSGGQQQRVALARAIVITPNVLLMDEPLSNLDAKLRIEMRSAIKDIQRQIGITTIYVTHDQEEALAISDRIAVMKNGVIQQVGSPINIYTRPYNVFVATFIGHSNLFYASIKKEGNDTYILFRCGYKLKMNNLLDVKDNDEVVVGIRPEEFFINSENEEGMKAKILAKTFLGKYTNYLLHFNNDEIIPNQTGIEYSQDSSYAERMYEKDEIIILKPNANKINVFKPDMEKSLIKGVKKYEI